MGKKFSIIISAYNIETYIERAIKSVLEQTFENYELIIVNDCSKDKTLEKIQNFKDERIIIINNEKNVGLGAVRNIGIAKAQGEYIVHLDGDDALYENTTLEKIDKLIDNDTPDIIYLGFKDVGGFNKVHLSTAENSTKEARLTCDINFSVPSKCWRREFLLENNIKFMENIYYEDMVYSTTATILAKSYKYGDFPSFKYYRNRKGSIMSTPSIRRCSDMYRMLAYLMDLYDITPDEYKPYLLSFIENETESLPLRVEAILKCLREGGGTPVFPKRNYKFKGDK
jgi:glycosyltransferase involved in cell wall biosynthesis